MIFLFSRDRLTSSWDKSLKMNTSSNNDRFNAGSLRKKLVIEYLNLLIKNLFVILYRNVDYAIKF